MAHKAKDKIKPVLMASTGDGEDDAVAVQVYNRDADKHTVGILNLDVAIVPDGKSWYAQALQIDYGVQGVSMEDAKSQFEDGLRATIHHNIQMYGTISPLLKFVPEEVWMELLQTAKSEHKTYSTVSFHEVMPDMLLADFPYETITYTEVSRQEAA
jgi:hypothetical protein